MVKFTAVTLSLFKCNTVKYMAVNNAAVKCTAVKSAAVKNVLIKTFIDQLKKTFVLFNAF